MDSRPATAHAARSSAAAILRTALSSPLAQAIAWNTLERAPDPIGDPGNHERRTDLVFNVQICGHDSLLHILFEHQSTSDPFMPARMLGYANRLWDVLATPLLAAFIPSFSIVDDDISHISDADLHKRTVNAFTRLALWALRDVRTSDDLHRAFLARQNTFRELVRASNAGDAIQTLLAYIHHVVQDGQVVERIAKTSARLAPAYRKEIMSYADQLREEGREEAAVLTRRSTLRKQLTLKFGAVDPSQDGMIEQADADTLDRCLERILTADSIDEVLTGEQ